MSTEGEATIPQESQPVTPVSSFAQVMEISDGELHARMVEKLANKLIQVEVSQARYMSMLEILAQRIETVTKELDAANARVAASASA